MLAPFPSMAFHGILGTFSFLKLLSCLYVLKSFENFLSAAIHFMVTLVSVLKSVIKRFENFCLKSMFESVGCKNLI